MAGGDEQANEKENEFLHAKDLDKVPHFFAAHKDDKGAKRRRIHRAEATFNRTGLNFDPQLLNH